MEILNVVSEFKTAVNFIFIKKCHAISRMNHATIGTNFLASLWLAPSNKKDKDVQQGTETNRDIKKQVTITKHYHLDTTKQQILSTTANLIIAKIKKYYRTFRNLRSCQIYLWNVIWSFLTFDPPREEILTSRFSPLLSASSINLTNYLVLKNG